MVLVVGQNPARALAGSSNAAVMGTANCLNPVHGRVIDADCRRVRAGIAVSVRSDRQPDP